MIGSLRSFRRSVDRRAKDLLCVVAVSIGLLLGSSSPATAQAKPLATIPVASPSPQISMPGPVGVTSQIVETDSIIGTVIPPASGSTPPTTPAVNSPVNSPGVIVTLIAPPESTPVTAQESEKPAKKKTTAKKKRTTKPATTGENAETAETAETTSTVKVRAAAESGTTEVPANKPTPSQDSILAALRKCESGGNYKINTGNGYYGAYQFALGTWRRLGYSGYPHEASPATQDEAVLKLAAKAGWGQWPACSRKLGLR